MQVVHFVDTRMSELKFERQLQGLFNSTETFFADQGNEKVQFLTKGSLATSKKVEHLLAKLGPTILIQCVVAGCQHRISPTILGSCFQLCKACFVVMCLGSYPIPEVLFTIIFAKPV